MIPADSPRSEIDPTKNVLDLVAASERRQDDLREAAEVLSRVKHEHSRELIRIHAKHSRELRVAEANRLDAIRSVDVAAASVIASQVSATAETLRALVSTTATTLAAQATATFNQLSDRISLLERSSYEGSGKSAVADPMMARMVETLEALRVNMAEGQGGKNSRADHRSNVGLIAVLIGVILSALMLAAVVIKGMGQ